jgi:ribulose-bisphosphate carboxylase large chain
MLRATFDVRPAGSVEAFAGLGGSVVAIDGGLVTVELPEQEWGDDVGILLSAVVAGEIMELRSLTRCRLVDLDVPPGLLPGPAFGATGPDAVGVIVKPPLGLTPAQVAEVARAAIAGGATFVKDDEILGDRRSCPLLDRVRAVARALEPGVVYCPNVTGPATTLLERARAAVDLGATGLLVNPFAQGIASLLALRRADLGVPIFAHRAGSGPWARNADVGPTGAVLARLLRLCGADFVVAGAFGGTLFEDDDGVRANLEAARGPCGGARPAVAALGGGLGPGDVAAQLDAAGRGGLLVLLGSRAYALEGGLEAAVRAAVAQL